MEQLQRVYVTQFLAPGVNKVLVCFSELQLDYFHGLLIGFQIYKIGKMAQNPILF